MINIDRNGAHSTRRLPGLQPVLHWIPTFSQVELVLVDIPIESDRRTCQHIYRPEDLQPIEIIRMGDYLDFSQSYIISPHLSM